MEAAMDRISSFAASATTTLSASGESTPFGVRSHLSQADIEYFAGHLETMRGQLALEITQLQQRTSFTPAGASDPDTQWDHAMAARSAGDKRALLSEIHQALLRVRDKTFGLCPIDARPIPRERLAEMPWVKNCEYCATHAQPGMPMDVFGVVCRSPSTAGELAD
jgi:RNA polymerase-binding transcription factor DksA